MTDLGTLGGATSEAWGINDAGEVVGESVTAAGHIHAFFWDGATMHDVDPRGGSPEVHYSGAWAINNQGQIVGWSETPGASVAFLRFPDASARFGAPGSEVYDINNADESHGTHVVGQWPTSPNTVVPILYDVNTNIVTGLSGLGGSTARARGVNQRDIIVGYGQLAGDTITHPFYCDVSGATHEITPLAGFVNGRLHDINDDGLSVGNVTGPSGVNPTAVLWSRGTGMTDVNALLDPLSGSGWGITILRDISNSGWMVGTGSVAGNDRAVLLRPLDADGDGLSYSDEVNVYGTDPGNADSDGDGLSDGDEVNVYGTDPSDADTDEDGLYDGDEVSVHGTDPNKLDTDGDGLSDRDEVTNHGTNPLNADSDGDGFSDGDEINFFGMDPIIPDAPFDLDEDGLPDSWERLHGLETALINYEAATGLLPQSTSWNFTAFTQPGNSASTASVGGGVLTINSAYRNRAYWTRTFSHLAGEPTDAGIFMETVARVVWETDDNNDRGVVLAEADEGDGQLPISLQAWGNRIFVNDEASQSVSGSVNSTIAVYQMDTTDTFHTYRLSVHKQFYIVEVDGVVVMAGVSPRPAATAASMTATFGDTSRFSGALLEVRSIKAGTLRDTEQDPDGDGLDNVSEYTAGTDPKTSDSDGDGLGDGDEVATHGTNPLNTDSDGDGLSDGNEVGVHHTDPLNPDTDGDGASDGDEVTNGTDPLKPPDLTPPTYLYESTAPAQTNVSPIPVSIQFNEAITGFAVGDIVAVNATVGSFSEVTPGLTFTFTLTPLSTGLVRASVPAGALTDLAGNPNPLLPDFLRQYVPAKFPVVKSITRGTANPTNASLVKYTVLFDEQVSGVDAADFSATTAGGVTGASISVVSGSGTSRVIYVKTGTGNGTVQLNVVDNDTIVNGLGNPLGGTGAGNGNISGPSYTIQGR